MTDRGLWVLLTLALALSAGVPSLCSADTWEIGLTPTQAATGSTTGTLTGSQYVQVLTAQPIYNPAGRPTADSYATQWQPNSILATVLSAIATGAQINIYVSTTLCDSATGRPTFIAIAFK